MNLLYHQPLLVVAVLFGLAMVVFSGTANIIAAQNLTLSGTVFLLACLIALSKNFQEENRKKETQIHQLYQHNLLMKTMVEEINHRSNGQLHFTTQLLHILQKASANQSVKAQLQDTENRIRALASINKRLAADDLFAVATLKEGFLEIAEDLQFSAEPLLQKKLHLHISLPPIETKVEKAGWLALLFYELMNNSVKYAFANEPHPNISLTIVPDVDGSIRFVYKDNGVGFEKHPTKTGGKGLIIIEKMMTQLKGKAEIDTSNGFCFRGRFPDFILVR